MSAPAGIAQDQARTERSGTKVDDRIPFAIVGAGPYGLALAHALAGRGVTALVLGLPMDTWMNHMPRGMFLKSEPKGSSIVASEEHLTLARYCAEAGAEYADVGMPVPLETFVSYGRWFQERAVPEVLPVEVKEIRRDSSGFELMLDDGSVIRARQVAIATGVRPFAYMPRQLLALPAQVRSHTIEHRDLGRFAGRRVVVVGRGQSALESAALISEAGGEATIVARADRVAWNPPPSPLSNSVFLRLRHPYSPLGSGWPLWAYSNLAGRFPALPERLRRRKAREVLGPAGAWWLRDRVEGRVPLLGGRDILQCDVLEAAIRVVLLGPEGIEEVDADHVLAATGYHVDVARLTLLSPELRQGIATSYGAPVLSQALESSVPGLFFTGIAAVNHFGPLMRFVCGAEFAARRVAQSVDVPSHILRRYKKPGNVA
jgi:Pyridine nucleotide-disulphide oxidoreductase